MKKAEVILGILISLWGIAIGAGMFILMRYDCTPGTADTAQLHWPGNSQIRLSADCPTLIMFTHPQCPCTRASITELGELIASCKTKIRTYVFLFSPKSLPAGWDRSALWRDAQSIPGVIVLNDIDGVESKRFHSETSGQTMIFSPRGELLFSGGITNARGQVGNNLNLNTAKLALAASSKRVARAPVFGCSIISLNKK